MYAAIHGRFTAAVIALLIGMLFDILDGKLASYLGQESDFGAELDSLADLVSFGATPFIIIMSYYQTDWLTALAALIPICGALRLARYNINRKKTKNYFIGVPIDASTILMIALFITDMSTQTMAVCIAILAFLYVSPFRIPRLIKH